MANLGLTLKREAVITGVSYIVEEATGETPIVERLENKTEIKWRPGQARKMTDYLLDLTKSGKKTGKPSGKPSEGLNVDIEISPVVIPLVFKKYWPYLLGFSTTLIMIGRLTK